MLSQDALLAAAAAVFMEVLTSGHLRVMMMPLRLNQFISEITPTTRAGLGWKRVNFKGNIMRMKEGNFLRNSQLEGGTQLQGCAKKMALSSEKCA